ncbi:hypothetical protein CCP3SC15_780001 [Gammaproteobacteria bacterium]
MSLRDVLEMVRAFRRDDPKTPVVLMGYLNPVAVMGYQTFATAAAEAGVDGVLTVDLPPEESGPLVVVGSALVSRIETLAQQGVPMVPEVVAFLAGLRAAIDAE